MLIHREVLENIEAPWFDFERNKSGMLLRSEDYNFCQKVKKLGYKIYVDPEAPVGHLKTVDLMSINSLLYKTKANNDTIIEDIDNIGVNASIFKSFSP